jgi:hypothetical protein
MPYAPTMAAKGKRERETQNSLTRGAEPFFRSCQLCSYSRTSQNFMEPDGLFQVRGFFRIFVTSLFFTVRSCIAPRPIPKLEDSKRQWKINQWYKNRCPVIVMLYNKWRIRNCIRWYSIATKLASATWMGGNSRVVKVTGGLLVQAWTALSVTSFPVDSSWAESPFSFDHTEPLQLTE